MFQHPQKNDAFTVNDTSKGNGALTYPVGLITADEIVAAGSGKYGIANRSYYLYKNSSYYYWSLSPYYFAAEKAYVFIVTKIGSMQEMNVDIADLSVAPIINLSADYAGSMKGTGTMRDPYQVL